MRLPKLWQDSPVMILVQKLTERILKRTHQMVALAIAVIIRIMALMAAAAIDGVTYHKEIQTAEFVRN